MTEEENRGDYGTSESAEEFIWTSGNVGPFVQLALEIRPQAGDPPGKSASAITCVHLCSDEVENQVMLTLIQPECSDTALISSKMSYFSPEWVQTGLIIVI